jgi:hypothetical protein
VSGVAGLWRSACSPLGNAVEATCCMDESRSRAEFSITSAANLRNASMRCTSSVKNARASASDEGVGSAICVTKNFVNEVGKHCGDLPQNCYVVIARSRGRTPGSQATKFELPRVVVESRCVGT